MWKYIIYILVSILIIFILHSIYHYLKNTYTVKKTKNVIDFEIQKYKLILEELQSAKTASPPIPPQTHTEDATDMDEDLTNFLAELI